MNHFFRLIFSLSFAAFMVASAGQSSNAAPAARQQSANFDGLWSVAIVTLQGLCDHSYRYPARIAGSRVMQANADPGYRLYGAVSRSGAIRVIVVRGSQWADGRGRLTDGHGAGNWSSSAANALASGPPSGAIDHAFAQPVRGRLALAAGRSKSADEK